MTDNNKTTNDLYVILEEIKNQKTVLVFNEDDFRILKEIIEDRKAVGRVWSWLKYAVGSLAAIIVGWQVVTGEFIKWIKQGIN